MLHWFFFYIKEYRKGVCVCKVMYIPLARMNILWYTITTITKETIELLERVPEEDQFVMPTTECGKMQTNKFREMQDNDRGLSWI